VHRDVSPANVLVSYGGEVKLIDFGIAKAAGALAVTQDGVVRGKLGYAAPEQCLGQPADPRSDVYAVGVMLWEAIAGRRRVSGETWQSVLQARLDDTEPALEEVCPDAPAELAAIVRKAVARDPADRYASATDFQADLETYLRSKRGTPIGPARIAALLKPHFERDRAELRRSIEAFLTALRSGKAAGGAGRLPLPGGRPAPKPVATPAPGAEPVQGAVREEQTAPIPVDSALLLLSRSEAESAGAEPSSSTPTVPPPSGLPTTPPGSSTPTAPPPPPLTTTAPPPPGAAALPPPSAAFPSLEPESIQTEDIAATPVAVAPVAPPAPGPGRKAPAAMDPFGLVSVASSAAATATPWPDAAIAAPPGTRKAPVWALAALALGAIGLGAVLVPLFGSKTDTAAAQESAPAAQPAQKAAASAKVAQVNVRISVDPADAVLTLDGRTLEGNPFVTTLPRDNAEHVLTAIAEGCQDHRQTVRLNADLRLLVAMKCQRQGMRLTAKPGARKATPSPGSGTIYPQPVAPAQLGGGAPAPAPAPAEEAVSPDNPYK
jgi:hypothetical protein